VPIHILPDIAGGLPVDPGNDIHIARLHEKQRPSGELIGTDLYKHLDGDVEVFYTHEFSTLHRGHCRRIDHGDAVWRCRYATKKFPGLSSRDLYRIHEHLPAVFAKTPNWWGEKGALR